jgi:hypothetical protein
MQGEGHEGGAHDLELARAVLPVLLARIEGSTRRLERIEQGLATPSEGADPSAALGEEVREAEGLGWLLGWIAGGLGAELLLERHEPRALALALELVDAVLRRSGGGIEAGPVPRVSSAGGWRLAWSVAGLVWRAGQERAQVVHPRIGPAPDAARASLALDGEAGEPLRARARALERELDGTRFEPRPCGWSWSFPSRWLEYVA